MPALAGLDEIELAAVCTSRPESAAAAAEAFAVLPFTT
jgi:predicted dehydrogenase